MIDRPVFVIEDELHCELMGEFETLAEAVAILKVWTEIAWDQEPNLAPCTNWASCGRNFQIIEYAGAQDTCPVRSIPVLEVSATSTRWLLDQDWASPAGGFQSPS